MEKRRGKKKESGSIRRRKGIGRIFSSWGTKKFREEKKLQDLQKTYLRRLSRRNENRSGIASGGSGGGEDTG